MGAELTAVDLVRPHPNPNPHPHPHPHPNPNPNANANSTPNQRLCMTLLRFDCCYHKGFGIRTAKPGGVLCDATGTGAPSAYPSLAGYVREIYALVAPEVDWCAFRQYYRWAPGVAPEQPLPDVEMVKASAEQPHGREGVGAAS
jgi:hypothetical protein